MKLLLMVVTAVLGSLATTAHAGVCLDDEELGGYVAELERHAKGGPAPSEYWLLCLKGNATFQSRVVKACSKIVEGYDAKKRVVWDEANLEASQRASTQAGCVRALAAAGVIKVGALDTVEILLAAKWGLFDEVTDEISTLLSSGDARVKPFLVSKVQAHLATVRAKPLRGWKAESWNRWQRAVLGVLAEQGDAADVALIDELLSASRDKRVRKAAEKAKAKIASRGK